MPLGTALKISKGHMWHSSIEDKPGSFASALEPFAKAGLNLQIVCGWAPSAGSQKQTGSMEIFPITDEKSQKCAQEAGLKEMTDLVCLVVEGEDSPGLAYKMAKAIADAGVNTRYAMAQGVKGHFLACFGFHNDTDAEKAKTALTKI
jgi:hypothetical protein